MKIIAETQKDFDDLKKDVEFLPKEIQNIIFSVEKQPSFLDKEPYRVEVILIKTLNIPMYREINLIEFDKQGISFRNKKYTFKMKIWENHHISINFLNNQLL